MEGALFDDQTWSYAVGSYCSSSSPHIVLQNFPEGSFAATQWQEDRAAITTNAVKEFLAGAPARA